MIEIMKDKKYSDNLSEYINKKIFKAETSHKKERIYGKSRIQI